MLFRSPIISAEKIPGLAVRMTTRVMVCHGVAPSASEPRVYTAMEVQLGTLSTQSDWLTSQLASLNSSSK